MNNDSNIKLLQLLDNLKQKFIVIEANFFKDRLQTKLSIEQAGELKKRIINMTSVEKNYLGEVIKIYETVSEKIKQLIEEMNKLTDECVYLQKTDSDECTKALRLYNEKKLIDDKLKNINDKWLNLRSTERELLESHVK